MLICYLDIYEHSQNQLIELLNFLRPNRLCEPLFESVGVSLPQRGVQ